MIVRLLENLDKNAFEPIVITQKRGELYKNLPEISKKIIPFDGVLRQSGLTKKLPNALPSLCARILQYNWRVRDLLLSADIIWCHNVRAVLTISPLAKLVSAPVIWNIGLGRVSEGKYRYLHKLSFSFSDYVFIESEEQLDRIFQQNQIEKHRNRFRIFYKGIDTDEFDPDKFSTDFFGSGTHVGTAASIVPRKGISQFVDAAKMLTEDQTDIQFHIAVRTVDNQYQQEIESDIQRAGLSDRITFHGWVDNIPAYLSGLDVFVLTSKNEGIPGAVREALAMETPVIATDVGGTSEAVLDGECGYLVGVGDIKETARRIEQLLNNESMRHQFGEAGRNHIVRNFSIESYTQSYESFFLDIS
jgi:glycosyltransferase involved in cell wall biosynthesis